MCTFHHLSTVSNLPRHAPMFFPYGPPVPLVCVLLPAGSLAQHRLHARACCGAARQGGGVWPCDRLLHHCRLPGGVWCPVVHHEELADGQLAGTAKCVQLARCACLRGVLDARQPAENSPFFAPDAAQPPKWQLQCCGRDVGVCCVRAFGCRAAAGALLLLQLLPSEVCKLAC